MVPVPDNATAASHADADTLQERSGNPSVTVDSDKITQWKSLLQSFAVLLLTMKGTYSLSESCIKAILLLITLVVKILGTVFKAKQEDVEAFLSFSQNRACTESDCRHERN